MPRDRNGRFSKASNEGLDISLNIPSLKSIIYWIILMALLMPWIIIVLRLDAFGIIINKFEELMTVNLNERPEQSKKNGLFY